MDRRQTYSPAALAICFALLLAVFAAFSPALAASYINLDDPIYLTANPHVLGGLTAAGARWALTATRPGYWQPLSWLSLMLDVSLFGPNPHALHLTNLMLHDFSVVVLFLALRGMTGSLWRSAAVAAIYGLHPLRVESVAWIAERKDVLSNLLACLTLAGYVAYARSPTPRRYALVLIAFILAVSAKPMVVTLPLLLLLLDYWPLRRCGGISGEFPRRTTKQLAAEKLPLALVALVAGIAALRAQADAGAMLHASGYPPALRLANAATAFGWSISRTLWFFKLAAFYPIPTTILRPYLLRAAVIAILMLAMTVFAWLERRRRPWLIVGWGWFVCALLPVSGILQAGMQLTADRFTYLPSIGLTLLLVWSVPTAISRAVMRPVAAAIIAILGFATWLQCGYWKDSMTLFSHALSVTGPNYFAYDQIGLCYAISGDARRAQQAWLQALVLFPTDPGANYDLGAVLCGLGHNAQAIPYLQRAAAVLPNRPQTHNLLGIAFQRCGELQNAASQFQAAIRCDRTAPQAHLNLGRLLAQVGDWRQAQAELRIAVALDPGDPNSRLALADCDGRLRKAAATSSAALDLRQSGQ